MERRSRGGNDDDSGSLSMHVYFTEISGGVLGENLIRGHDVVLDVDNIRVGIVESGCNYDEATEERE